MDPIYMYSAMWKIENPEAHMNSSPWRVIILMETFRFKMLTKCH